MAKTSILNATQIQQKVERMAWQLLEMHHTEKELVLVGIANNGHELANRMRTVLERISQVKISLHRMDLNKRNLLENAAQIAPAKDFSGCSVVVVDDVLNTGGTMMYALKHFLDFPLKRLSTAVLVDRSHRNFPVKADVKGLVLSTTLLEHVDVVLEASSESVFLS